MALAHPDALEKIFLKLEEESERRAKEEEAAHDELPELSQDGTVTPDPDFDASRARKQRRRGSVSISRFGQGAAPSTQLTFSVPQTPTSNHPFASFYQATPYTHSSDSLHSTESDDAPGRRTAHDHITQVHRIAGRQSISRHVGGMLSRTLSRSRSKNSLTSNGVDTNVVIGVVVEEAHAEADELHPPRPATAYGPIPQRELRERPSRVTIGGEGTRGWKGIAEKFFANKFRRRSTTLSASMPVGS